MSRAISGRPLASAFVLIAMLGYIASAPAITINITATVNGTANTQLGTIDATYAGGVEEGTFQLDNAQLGLMNDPCCQFRWFQVVTEDTDPINYGGNPLNAPYVDPPSGGWDYQAGQGGADTSPFYENDDNGNYAFPNYSGTFNVFGGNNNVAVHDANTGTSRTQDVPGTTNGHSLTFWTFITFVNCDNPTHFTILGGYEWGLSLDGAGTPSYSGPTGPIDMSVDEFRPTIDSALAADGFGSGWSYTVNGYGENIVCPEPASFALIGLGGFFLLRRRAA